MEKMTIEQELNKLKEEVLALKKQQNAEGDEQKSKKHHHLPNEEKIKEQLSTVFDHIKKDYESLSPTSAVLIFALGIVFGRVLSK